MGNYSAPDKNTGDQFTAAEHNQLKVAVNDNDSRLSTAETKLAGIEAGATADQTDAEIATAYGNEVPQVSAGEITAGTETSVRRYSPADVVSIIAAHESAGGTLENTHRDLHFPATRLIPRVTDGATLGTVESSGLTYERMAFSVAGNEQGAVLNFVLPDDYVAGTELKAKLHILTNNATSGAVTWGIRCMAFADGVSAYPTLGNEVLVSETIINGGDTVQRTVTSVGLDIPGTPGPGKTVYVQVVLKTTSAADCNLLTLTLQYEATRQSLTTYIVPTDSSAPTAPVITEVSETSDGGTYTIDTESTHPVYAINYQFVVDGAAYGDLFTTLSPTLTGLADGSYQVGIRPVAIVPGGANIGGAISNQITLNVSSVYVPPLDGMTHTARGCWWLNRQLYAASTNAFRISRDSDAAEVDVAWDGDGRPTTATITSHAGVSLPGTVGRVGDLRLVTNYDQSPVGLDRNYTTGAAQAPELWYDPAAGIFFPNYDGTTDMHGSINENPNYTIPQPALWFTGVRAAGTPGSTIRVRNGFAQTNHHQLSQYNTGFFGIQGTSGAVIYTTTNTNGANALITQNFDGASSYIMNNGIQEGTGTLDTNDHEDLFEGVNSNGNGQYFNGGILGELCVSGLSNADRDTLNTALIDDLTA